MYHSVHSDNGLFDSSHTQSIFLFYTLPPSAKTGILDMHYNMGGNKFNSSKFPNLFEGLRQKNYQYSGIESHRTGIGEARNKKVQEKFNRAQQEYQHHERYGKWR